MIPFYRITKGIDIINEEKVIVFYYSKKNLIDSTSSLTSIATKIDYVHSRKLTIPADSNLNLLYYLQYVTCRCHLGSNMIIESAAMDKYAHCYLSSSTGKLHDRIEQYIEEVKTRSGVIVGWRFFYVIKDPFYILDVALENLCQDLNEPKERDFGRAKKLAAAAQLNKKNNLSEYEQEIGDIRQKDYKGFPDYVKPLFDIGHWKEWALHYAFYTTGNNDLYHQARTCTLTDSENPIISPKVFNFTHSVDLINVYESQEDIDFDFYSNKDLYFSSTINISNATLTTNEDDGISIVGSDEEEEDDEIEVEEGSFIDTNLTQQIATPITTECNQLHLPLNNSYYVPHRFVHPNILLKCNFNFDIKYKDQIVNNIDDDNDDGDDDDNEANKNSDTRIINLTELREKNVIEKFTVEHLKSIPFNTKAKNVVETIKQFYKENPINIYDLLNTENNEAKMNTIMLDLDRLLNEQEISNPGGFKTTEWFRTLTSEQRVLNKQNSTHLIHMSHDLSDFGNIMTREIYFMELYLGISHIHSDLLMAGIISLDLYEVVQERLRFNLLMIGNSQSGKSFIMEELQKLLVPGTFQRTTAQTDNSLTSTEVNFNGIQQHYDELPSAFIKQGEDRSGFAALKSMLTVGKTFTKTCYYKKGEPVRLQHETVCSMMNQTVACSNARIHTIPKPILSRLYTRPIYEIERLDINLLAEKYDTIHDVTKQTITNDFFFKWHMTAVITNRIELLCMEGALYINLDVCNELLSRVRKHLIQTTAIKLDIRSCEQIAIYAKSLTVFYAINKVFFSGEVLPIGVEYDDTYIMRCAQFLICTTEIFFYAFTTLSDLYVNPTLKLFIDWVKKKIEIGRQSLHDMFAAYSVESDPYYYFIPVKHSYSDAKSLQSVLAAAIYDEISTTPNIYNTTEDNVWMTIKSLTERFNLCDVVPLTTDEQPKISQLIMRYYNDKKSTGFLILKQYVDGFDQIWENLIPGIMDLISDRYIPPHTKFVSGMTYKFGYPIIDNKGKSDMISIPFINKCFTPKTTLKRSKIKNPDYIRYGHSDFTRNIIHGNNHTKPFITIYTDIDTYFKRKFLKQLGCSDNVLSIIQLNNETIHEVIGSTYPNAFILEHIKHYKLIVFGDDDENDDDDDIMDEIDIEVSKPIYLPQTTTTTIIPSKITQEKVILSKNIVKTKKRTRLQEGDYETVDGVIMELDGIDLYDECDDRDNNYDINDPFIVEDDEEEEEVPISRRHKRNKNFVNSAG